MQTFARGDQVTGTHSELAQFILAAGDAGWVVEMVAHDTGIIVGRIDGTTGDELASGGPVDLADLAHVTEEPPAVILPEPTAPTPPALPLETTLKPPGTRGRPRSRR
jgi:hypothetical protein